MAALPAGRAHAPAMAQRARIVLQCAEGLSNTAVAKAERVTVQTVGKWRARFLQDRLAGLEDNARSGAPRTLTDAQVERVVRDTLEIVPKHGARWSTRTMAAHCGLTHDAVHRIWKAFGLQPHREESLKLSTDPFFIEKVEDVVGLYVCPPDQALVLAVAAGLPPQTAERLPPGRSSTKGRPERQPPDSFRFGAMSLFAALDGQTGEGSGQRAARAARGDFLRFLRQANAVTPAGMDLHLVLNNYATHKTPAVHRWLVRHPRFRLHFIPTSRSWLRQVERWFDRITVAELPPGRCRSVPQLRQSILDYVAAERGEAQPFAWTTSADLMLGRADHLYSELG